ncbi:MAG: TetR family transcriptional regulator [Lentisphaeraceae bacterium]|nr:TetR family transcriptional regulator [Lentisphaeraceae bacterium]
MTNTKESILDVAECLFAKNGYAGTSIRAIVEEAEVNIAAINYHFISKEGLFMAVIQRRFKEIERQRFSKLDSHLKNSSGKPALEGIVRAFLEPLKYAFDTNDQVPKMLVRVFCESEELKDLINPIFDETRKRFLTAMKMAYSKLPETEVQWRFQYMVSAMVGLIIFSENIHKNFASLPENKDLVEKLITQTLEGIQE